MFTSRGGGGNICICEPSDLKDGFHFAKSKDEIESVLAKIEKIYSRSKLPKHASRNGCCSCVGLLAPATNIIVNFLICKDAAELLPEGQEAGGMIQRSLDGLIAFLTCLFPYLPDAEALAYLSAADGDPLVAALIIIDRRGLTRESFITETGLEIALRSAAVAAQHPDPQRFMRGWKLVSLCPQEFAKLAVPCDDSQGLIFELARIMSVFDGSSTDLCLADGTSWELARDRLSSWKGGLPRLPPVRATMKRLLLSMIHGFYLKALGALPKKELTDCYHRSLLMGGHCYGPLDPVSNIIVNTIWYDQTFPAREVQPLNMISTNCLWRITARSLYGLVSFLRSRYPNLTPDQALQRLLDARAELSFADPLLQTGCTTTSRMLRKDAEHIKPHATLTEAYVAAATAAFHPSPLLQKDFLGIPDSVRNLMVISEMLSVHDGQTIPKEKFECLLILLKCPSSVGTSPRPQQELEHKQVSKRVYVQASVCKNMFWGKHERVNSIVRAVLDKYNETAVSKYSLHVICGVNELVDREFSLDRSIKCHNPRTPYKYNYSHINFLATREGSSSATLFFAECSNHCTSNSWCVPVLLQPDAGICTMAGTRPESRPGVGTRPETGVQPDAGAGIHTEADADAGMRPGAGIRSESGPDAGDGIRPGAPDAGMRRGPGIRPEAARCIYCEFGGSKILHPIAKSFRGRDDFKKLSGGGLYTNNRLIKKEVVDWVYGSQEETIYFNYWVDADATAADGYRLPKLRRG